MAVTSGTQAGVLWEQDFSAGGAFSNYVGSGPNKFSTASNYAQMTTSNFNLGMNTATNALAGVFGLDFGDSAGYLQFSFNPTSTGSVGVPALISIGDGTSNYTTFGTNILSDTAGTWSIRDTAHGFNSVTPFTGNQTITIVLNNSGSTYNYDLGGGISGSIANDIYRIYVGSTLLSFNAGVPTTDLTPINPNAAITGFQITAQGRAGTYSVFDNIVFATTPVPEPSITVLLIAGIALVIAMARIRQQNGHSF